ncbi:hypothetical protein TTHERM_001246669 (macronuclear) [Tetrahymena thermophila SB210]|uniref:Uncharacterized protein n=1 Tax=Tetrahymena thermophila (strain SB210) TaxID=312017 RepID=W7X9Q7_TETTS|nr:hypothetical protein TTHERM_001246669 [Tetrahymena thermophila SB210]EWS76145.1 hypothetical protein TTHERM_001246669 [Tetrahymena thermophila SB210]|eukprot:XP_012651319.1 hypothetical protein TTHERM_001246669 [Tetrahymena thermophila SB210]
MQQLIIFNHIRFIVLNQPLFNQQDDIVLHLLSYRQTDIYIFIHQLPQQNSYEQNF